MDRLVIIVKEIEEKLRWKRNHKITIPFYITQEEENTLSGAYIITREPMDWITFERRKGYKVFIRDNEIWVRRNHGNKKRKN